MTTYKWINLYPLAVTEGFVYFKAYVNQTTNQVVGWVTRSGLVEPYGYSVYWLDQSRNVHSSTRGTWQHADWAVQGSIASLRTTAGVSVISPERDPKLVRVLKSLSKFC